MDPSDCYIGLHNTQDTLLGASIGPDIENGMERIATLVSAGDTMHYVDPMASVCSTVVDPDMPESR